MDAGAGEVEAGVGVHGAESQSERMRAWGVDDGGTYAAMWVCLVPPNCTF